MDSVLHRIEVMDRRNRTGPARGPFSGMLLPAVPAGGQGHPCRRVLASAGLYGAGSNEPAAYSAADRPMHG
jgi:hypothetical protein